MSFSLILSYGLCSAAPPLCILLAPVMCGLILSALLGLLSLSTITFISINTAVSLSLLIWCGGHFHFAQLADKLRGLAP